MCLAQKLAAIDVGIFRTEQRPYCIQTEEEPPKLWAFFCHPDKWRYGMEGARLPCFRPTYCCWHSQTHVMAIVFYSRGFAKRGAWEWG